MAANYFMLIEGGAALDGLNVNYFSPSGPTVAEAQAAGATLSGVPADMAAWPELYRPDGYIAQKPTTPGGFRDAAYRVVRDPGIFTDDSANPPAQQVYDHCWPLIHALCNWLQDTPGYGAAEGKTQKGERDAVWPLPFPFAILAVNGTPVVDDGGSGWYGMTTFVESASMNTRGSMDLVSGAGGANRMMSTILTDLAATTSAQRTTIADTYTSTKTAIDAARVNLNAVLTGAAVSGLDRQRYWARAELAHVLASGAVGVLRKDHQSGLGAAVLHATRAIVAKEAGLIGATFTTTNYENMTQPLGCGARHAQRLLNPTSNTSHTGPNRAVCRTTNRPPVHLELAWRVVPNLSVGSCILDVRWLAERVTRVTAAHRRIGGTTMKVSPWHSIKSDVHHNETNCNTGNNIERENRREGTGGKPLCAECKRY